MQMVTGSLQVFFNFIFAAVSKLKAEHELLQSQDYGEIHRNQKHFSGLPTWPQPQNIITDL